MGALCVTASHGIPCVMCTACVSCVLPSQVIPGNEAKVAEMLNSLALRGARVMASRADNLHVSGHAYQVHAHKRPGAK